MSKRTLTVFSLYDRLVSDYEALDSGVRRYIGYTFNPEHKAFELELKPVVIPYRAEYMRALRDGDLLAADDATRALVNR
jgi:hypothetical protein